MKITTEIQKVPAFKSLDGTMFQSKREALDRNYQIELRGLFQRSVGGANQNFSSTDIARVLKANSKDFIELMRKFNEAIQRNTPKTVGVPHNS